MPPRERPYLISGVSRGVLVGALALGWGWGAPAAAQPAQTPTLLVGSGSLEAPVSASVASGLRDQLRAHGSDVMTPDALRTAVEERLSREPVPVGSDEVSELADAVRELEALVATRQRETALRQAEHVRTLSEGTVDALAERRELARTLMSGCLADAWLHLQMDEGDAARDRLHACREMHPDVEVDTRTTPPRVSHLLQEIDAELASRPRHTVRLDTAVAGCDVLLNGRHFGTTPQPLPDVPIGRYQVELACPGLAHRRVHTLVVADEDRSIVLDPSFDDALRSDTEVRLVYPTVAAERAGHVAYVQQLAVAVSAAEAVVVTPDGPATRADRVSAASGVIASVLIDDTSDLGAAAAALIEGRSIDLTRGGPRPYVAWSAEGSVDASHITEPTTPSASHDDGAMIAGVVVGSAGTLSLAAGWITFGYWLGFVGSRAGLDPALSRAYVLGREIEQTEWAGVPLGIGGAALIAGSIPLWLPDDGIRDVGAIPWWSWTIGVAGLIAVGVGAAEAALNSQTVAGPNFATCYCVSSQSMVYLASMLWETGGAALALPITHLVRVAIGPGAPSVRASVASTGASLSFEGTW